jgi:hypothetical protein
MFKKIIFFVFLLALITTSCNLGSSSKNAAGSEYDYQKAEVREVIQTTSYTYLRVEKNNQEQWIAISKQDINEGDIVYYEEGLEMTNFESAELHRTFESVYFVMDISDQPIKHGMPGGKSGGGHSDMGGGMEGNQPQKPVISKLDIQIEQPQGGTAIRDLYAKRDTYSGKMVTVRGQVTKVNSGIMGKNWVHLQDGTADGDNYDLTITTDDEPVMGEIVTYSGTLSLEKDFGYGYSYALLLEEAVQLKQQ